MDGHAVAARVLHAAQHQDLRAAGGHLEHFLVADPRDPPGGPHDPGISGEYPVHVGVDLARVRGQGRGERDRGGVRRAAAHRGDVLGRLRHTLEAGHDGDRAVGQRVGDPPRLDVDDARPAVRGVGDHARLGSGERARLQAEGGDRHGQQRHRDPLTGGQQHVELTRGRQRAHLAGQVHQLIGRVTHRGHDHHDLVAALAGGHDPLRDPLDAIRVSNRRATVFLHHERHGRAAPPRVVDGRLSLSALGYGRPNPQGLWGRSPRTGGLGASAPVRGSCSPRRRRGWRARPRRAAPAGRPRRGCPSG